MPKGQKRPVDVIGNAVTVMKIATGTDHIWSIAEIVRLLEEVEAPVRVAQAN